MQSTYAEHFVREMGCTSAEWLGWLPGAVRDCPLVLDESRATVSLPHGDLHLDWEALPPRRIALVQLPRLLVRFTFVGTTPDVRLNFMRYFDLYLQRGGG
ncbi:hypothetical protein [Caldimonas caldifontis]|uniref:Uncharacterized protein n=1 Tax=Caldimonas caldifontis TaxID=1452508 RepID=A0A2S5SSH1_9BURK|nr:hypothetical protein [Caldimonas caldifontis]PPE65663.1 hypothetical protein C1704_13625 [Caldimonas caldifontis]